MGKTTPQTTLGQIAAYPELATLSDFFSQGGSEKAQAMAQIPLGAFGQIGGSPEGLIEGVDRLSELCSAGRRMYYPLWSEDEAEGNPALRERYLMHFSVEEKTPFLLLASGGGYAGVATMLEGFPVSKEVNDLGYHAFTLNYRVGKNALAPNPVEDMAQAVRFILDHADELGVEREGYAVGGFSAGGHLAASFGTEANGWRRYGLPRPAAMILGYPVISMHAYTHAESRANLLGAAADDEEVRTQWSVEDQVSTSYPPTFVWQNERDNVVPIQNTQLFVEALDACEVPFDYRTFDSEWHGWGSGKGTFAEGWVSDAVAFWERQLVKMDA